jgi:DNA-binding LacI/PurR family transcriptional regulator
MRKGAMKKGKPLRMKDLADKAGVSTTTVSRALNGEGGSSPALRKRILKLAEEHGYRRLRRKPLRRQNQARASIQGRIALIAPGQIGERLTDPGDIYAALLTGARSQAADVGWDVVVDWTPTGEADALPEVVRRGGVDGALLVSSMPDSLVGRIAEKIPVVCVNTYTAWVDVPCFLVDNRRMMTLAVEHLAAFGHRRIGYLNEHGLGNDEPDRSYSINHERRESYLQAVRRLGLCLDEDLWSPFTARREVFAKALAKVLGRSLDRPEPATALLVPLRGMLHILPELARRQLHIPDDLSILAIDDGADATSIQPKLSAMSSNHGATVEAAMACLMDRIAGKAIPARAVWTEPKLRQRDSVAPPVA